MATQDALRRYQAKRNFSITSEPADGGEVEGDARTFVIQKHWARHLLYDFRLALDGTMKSWAVPKGPSFDSKVKRMAVHVAALIPSGPALVLNTKAEDYTDTFSAAVNKLVKQKVKAGKTENVTPLEDASSESGASNVIDLTELLAKSLAKRKPAAAAKSSVNAGSKHAGTAAPAAPPKQAARKRA